MTYSEKYPNAKPHEQLDATIMCNNKSDNCYNCGTMTKFIDTDFMAYVCSEECDEAITNEFFKAAMRKN